MGVTQGTYRGDAMHMDAVVWKKEKRGKNVLPRKSLCLLGVSIKST